MIIHRPHTLRGMPGSGRRRRRAIVAGVLIAAAALAGYLVMRPQSASAPPPVSPVSAERLILAGPSAQRGEVRFLGPDGVTKAAVKVEIADRERSRETGLMYRRSLGRDFGMLFVFDSSAMQTFWMKNTYISLDMIFVSEEKRIVTIHTHTVPRSLQTYPSTEPALFVVEVIAGFTEAHGVRVGDRMQWSRDTTAGVHE